MVRLNLDGAVTAELSVQYWGGHIGTSEQSFSVNGSEYIPLVQPIVPDGNPECYFRTVLGEAKHPLCMDLLTPGDNEFRFTCGPQLKYSFDWGFFWVYSFTVRVYFDLAPPDDRVMINQDAETFSDFPRVHLQSTDPAEIEQVDFIANYRGFDVSGLGRWDGWHYQFKDATPRLHVGSTRDRPFEIRWDTTWVPDQERPVSITARVRRRGGPITEAAAAIATLRRDRRRVEMHVPNSIPENFGVRVGRKKSCTFHVPRVGTVQNAALVLSTWSGAHASGLTFNGKRLVTHVGSVHDASIDYLYLPAALVSVGSNEFEIESDTDHHAAEVNLPGPALLMELEDE